MPDNPHKNHRARMRARYNASGFDGFADHEVLEFMLYYCYPRCDTNKIAHDFINKFGSLHNLLEADVETLQEVLGCTEKVAVFLSMIPAIANRYFRSRWGDATVLDKVETAGKYAIDLFVGETNENFYVLCLDKRFRLINTTRVSKGTTDEAAVYPREVFGTAIRNHATAIILAHNHPGGSMNPSSGDRRATIRISDGAELIGIDVIDHIIVAGDTYFSFAQRDMIVKGYPKDEKKDNR